MAVLNRTKAPAVPEDQNVTQHQAAAEGTPANERATHAAVQDAPANPRSTTTADRTAGSKYPAIRRRRPWRRRRDPSTPGAGVRAAAAGAGVVATIVRVVRLVVGVAVLVIALGIAFVALKASPSNTIVSHVLDWGRWLTTPFHGMFHVRGARGTLALNWGIAIVVYLAVTWLITAILLAPARAVRRRAVVD